MANQPTPDQTPATNTAQEGTTPETPQIIQMSQDQLDSYTGQIIAKVKSEFQTSPAFMQSAEPKGVPATVKRFGSLTNFKGGDGELRAYRFGMWCIAAATGKESAVKFCRENGLALKTMQETNNTGGGFSVPEEFGTDLIDLREQYGVFRRNARVVPMSSDTRTDPRRKGGLTAYFRGESSSATESDKTWDQVQLVAKKLVAIARYTSELNEDTVLNIGDDLAGEIAYAFAEKEDRCGFIGDGSATYGGIVGVTEKLKGVDGTIANIKGLVVASGNAYSEITLADFNKVVGLVPEYADPNAKWYFSKGFWGNVVQKLILASGGAAALEIVNGAREKRFLGYPVEISQAMPKAEANSQVCALLGDLRLAASLGDRRQTTISFSTEANDAFENDELLIKGTERFDINVHDVGNTTDAGPIVGLITAAS